MADFNNSINSTVGASISGVTNTLTITNASNTAASQARQHISVGGPLSGDPFINFNIDATQDWSMGIDNSDNDSYKLSASSSLGTSDVMVCTTSGEITQPLQPSFLARLTVPQNNITGSGGIGEAEFTTVDFDQNSDYDGIKRFTAPVDGIYLFHYALLTDGFTAAHTALFVSDRFGTSRVWEGDPRFTRTSSNSMQVGGSFMRSLTAGTQFVVG